MNFVNLYGSSGGLLHQFCWTSTATLVDFSGDLVDFYVIPVAMSDPSKIPEEVKKQIDDALGLWVNNAGVEKTPGISMINKPVMQSTIDVKKSNLASDGISSSGTAGDGNSLVVRKNGGSKDGISASNRMSVSATSAVSQQ
uniref:Uncharacterized protein n=1 Tax=Ditylenchus dipsaci TaxID=166011 RepID=A0A915DFV4_9BILA